ncbi:MAG TPA: hypothetical protein VFH49_11845, partial [Aquabacterium sp.]|nr:hypothetical protein [Aquabacterium sp.]
MQGVHPGMRPLSSQHSICLNARNNKYQIFQIAPQSLGASAENTVKAAAVRHSRLTYRAAHDH